MIVKVVVTDSPRGPQVLVHDEKKTLSFSGPLPQDIALTMGPRKVAFFEARVTPEKNLSLGASVLWQPW
jgi:hypothetical protein